MRRTLIVALALSCPIINSHGQEIEKVTPKAWYLNQSEIKTGGLLDESLQSSRKGRIAILPKWNNGELIRMFSKEIRDNHNKTDWYGEHGGKWLYTASLAAAQGNDPALKELVRSTADFLVTQQADDGYLGNYGTAIRLTSETASHKRSWDVWNLSYMTLGLLQTHRHFPDAKYLDAAKKIGELFITMFGDGKRNITDYGTRRGVSATVILDPIVELYKATNDTRYLTLAGTVVNQMEAKEDLKLITAGKNNTDMEHVGDGKIYQIIWTLTGVVKLYEVTGNEEYFTAAKNIWKNITDHHLTIAGGPWGGVGKHMECFNRKNFWSPYGLVETCSTMSWIQLNKEMLRLTGDAKYAQEIERSAYNALLGASFPNGTDWSYHSFTNGSWHIANFNDCCPSSGALALEELPSMIFSRTDNGVAVNLFAESAATISLDKKNTLQISQKTQYPFDGKVELHITLSKKATFPLSIRIPEWAGSAVVKINGKQADTSSLKSGEYFTLSRQWASKDMVEIEFPIEVKFVQQTEQLDAPQNAGEIYHANWAALTRGPLVFAVDGLIDGEDRERVLNVDVKNNIVSNASASGPADLVYELKVPGVQSLKFVPYYKAGGAKKGGWRLTWLQTGIQSNDGQSNKKNVANE